MSSSYSSLDWVLSHWAHFTVHRFICVYVFFLRCIVILHMCCIIVTWWGWSGKIEAWSLNIFLQCFDTVGWVIWSVKPVPDMTYNVFSGTLNHTQSINQKLDQFHLRCRRRIAYIRCQEHVANTAVLKICNISGIEALLQTAQLRWCGHVIRMDDTRIPKQVFYGQLRHGFRRPGGQYKRYKDCLQTTLNQCDITPSELETLARDRTDSLVIHVQVSSRRVRSTTYSGVGV